MKFSKKLLLDKIKPQKHIPAAQGCRNAAQLKDLNRKKNKT